MTYIAYVKGSRHKEIPLPLKYGDWKRIVSGLTPDIKLLVVMQEGEFDRLRSSIYWRARECGMPVSIAKIANQLEVRVK